MEIPADATIITTSRKLWVMNIGSLSLIILLVILPLTLSDLTCGLISIGFLIILLPSLFRMIKFARSCRLIFTDSELIYQSVAGDTRIDYAMVKAIRSSTTNGQKMLILNTEDDEFRIPCMTMDLDLIKAQLKSHFSEEVLHPLAYQKTNDFITWKEKTYQAVAAKGLLRVKFGGFNKKAAWVSTVLGLSLFLFSIISDHRLTGAGYAGLLFLGPGIFLFIFCIGVIEADRERISVKKLLHTSSFSWDDLEKHYMSYNNGAMALIGRNHRLIIPAISSWSGPDEADLLDLIRVELEIRNIETIMSMKPELWWSK